MKKSNIVELTIYYLVLIGAFNWGLVGIFDFDLVKFLCKGKEDFARVIYILVGLAALYLPILRVLNKTEN
jgi:hypothetical protein